jgi:hypothetical protein
MAKLITKGTVISHGVTTTLTAVAQVIDFSLSGSESETYDATTIDNADPGKIYAPTGFTESGDFSFSMFWDSALAGHQLLTDVLNAPAESYWGLLLADGTTNTATFNGGGVGLGIDGAMADGVKGSVSVKISGLVDHAT